MTDGHERVRACVLQHGWNSTCYQLLNPGFRYWLSRRADAVVGYVEHAGVRIVAGAPVTDLADLPQVVTEFERDTVDAGLGVCYFASEARLEGVIGNRPGYAVMRLGAQPVWHPARLVETMHAKASLRHQLNRAVNKNVAVEEWPATVAADHPALKATLARWLAARGLPSLHFLVEPDTLSNQRDRRIFVARRGDQVVGFVNLSPVPLRNGWLVEQFVRDVGAPNGTVELMLDRAANALARDGFTYVTLGLSPLTSRAGPSTCPERVPIATRLLLGWARAHGRRFYNFEGLEFFKAKFEPERWESIYAISKDARSAEPRFSLWALYAIACAFTKGRPVFTVSAGMVKAFRQELRWLATQRAVHAPHADPFSRRRPSPGSTPRTARR